MMDEYIWLTYERCYGILISMGAHFSLVKYKIGGIEYEVMISNDEYQLIDNDE
jgi:hypothetical protein